MIFVFFAVKISLQANKLAGLQAYKLVVLLLACSLASLFAFQFVRRLLRIKKALHFCRASLFCFPVRYAVADLAVSASLANPAGSEIARSARIFRSRAIPVLARPAMNLL